MPRYILVLLLLIPVFASGCQTASKVLEVIKDPDIQVGGDGEQPSKIVLNAYAAAEVNRNFEDTPSPVMIRVFALSSDHRFYSYDFFSLTEDTEKTLGVTLLDYLDENMIKPDSYKILGPYELPKGTRKIGVIAEYLDIEASTWRTSIDVKAIGADEQLLLFLLEEEVRLVREE